ncbi:hypothetical protein D3C86_1525830 [compost metagenome]
MTLGQGQQRAEHVLDHAAGIAARCAGPGDTRLGEVRQVQMIGADGAGADELHRRALQQRPVDAGHRAHQQHIGVGHGGAVDGAAGQAADLAEGGEEGIEQRDVFVGQQAHGSVRRKVGKLPPLYPIGTIGAALSWPHFGARRRLASCLSRSVDVRPARFTRPLP